MEARRKMRAEIRRRSRGRRAEYPPIAGDEVFSAWFPAAVERDMAANMHVKEDVETLPYHLHVEQNCIGELAFLDAMGKAGG